MFSFSGIFDIELLKKFYMIMNFLIILIPKARRRTWEPLISFLRILVFGKPFANKVMLLVLIAIVFIINDNFMISG